MKIRLTASEVSRSFSDVLNRVVYRQEEFIVERNGQPACQIIPVAPSLSKFTVSDLESLLQSLPAPDPAFWDDVEEGIQAQGEAPPTVWPR